MANYNKLRVMVGGLPTTIDMTAAGNVLQAEMFQIVNAAVTASKPAKLDADKKFTSGDIDLTSEVTGALPYANMNIADADLTIAKTSGLQSALDAKQSTSEKGANNGYASLDAGGKVPAAQLPNSIMDYKGTWAASTNTPTLADGTGNAGDVYIASDAGTVDFGAGNITFAQGDWVIYNGATWEKSINSNAVASVNGQTGVVVLTTTNISEGTNLYFTDARAKAAAVNDTAYGVSWDGVTDVAPSKNAVYDKIESIGGAVVSDEAYGIAWDGVTSVAPSKNAVYDKINAVDTAVGLNTTHRTTTTGNPHSVTKTEVGLGNVDNVQQLPLSYLDTDDTLSADSDTKVPSQQAVKAYIDAVNTNKDSFAAVAGESFAANKTHLVRWALNGETAGRVYKATSDHQNAANKFWAIGVIRPTSAIAAADPVTVIRRADELALLADDTNFVAATDDGLPLFLNKDGAFSTNADAGITTGEQYASSVIGQQKSYNATVTSSTFELDVSKGSFQGIDLGA